jgi:hypothetical protein
MKTLQSQFEKRKGQSMILLILFLAISFNACTEEEDVLIDEEIEENLPTPELPYAIVSTNQLTFYGNQDEISTPQVGDAFYGQDACYTAASPNYTDNGDETITDNITGIMWQKNAGEKMTYDVAVNSMGSFDLAGYSDWRLPTIKELFSLIIFSGLDPSGYNGTSASGLVPFIDTDYFDFEYGDESVGERIIDAQFATSSLDVGDSNFGGGNLMFGVNFADGRIKGYPTGAKPGQSSGKTFFVLYVRGNQRYGENSFVNNGNGTITDNATGLMWMQNDSDQGMNWQEALEYAEGKEFAGDTDWRLPNVKELQSIVDYSRAPGATNSAAIDPAFNCTQITNEGGQSDYPYYWSGTTHVNMQNGRNAAYVSFGRALGYFNGEWLDVHGAGAQRSDPKIGSASDWPTGHGPQGDAIRINNFVRLVRNQ